MSYFDDASLVMIPSGYKTSKVYSVKPTDGTGDLTFSRSNDTATRVGPDGLIEKVRTNRFTYSQNIANAAWKTATDGGTITKTANAGTAPDGTNTATRVQVAGGGTYSLIYQDNVNPLGSVVVSGYFKRYGGTNQTFRLFGDNGSALSLTLTATDTWQRFSFVMNASSAGADGLAADASNNAYDILVWGMQLETGDIATPYIATTTAAVSVGPVANVPRLDYLNSSCPRLLLEPQRTNSATYSEQINNAAWNKLNVTVSANQAVSPDGTTSADLVYPTTTGTDRLIEQVISATIGQTWTSSLFVKASGFTWVLVYAPNLGACWFNASTGVFGTIAGNVTATVLGQVNGYWRISFTGTIATSNAYFYAGPANANGTSTATTNGTNGLLFWGCQLEQGAYATSYIPTLGAAVTRGADAAVKTGISSLIGQTEGTLFVDFTLNGLADYGTPISVNNGTTAQYIWLTIFGNGILRAELFNGSAQASISYSGAVAGGRYKMAFGYKANDFALYVNGALVGADLTGTTFSGTTLSRVDTNLTNASVYSTASESINQALLFTTRLTNAQLAELTA